MSSRIVIGGRALGSGKYGVKEKCLCGEPIAILGRCLDCHEALRRRRLGLPPKTEQERKRLAGYMEKFEAASSKCRECGATIDEGHAPDCYFSNL